MQRGMKKKEGYIQRVLADLGYGRQNVVQDNVQTLVSQETSILGNNIHKTKSQLTLSCQITTHTHTFLSRLPTTSTYTPKHPFQSAKKIADDVAAATLSFKGLRVTVKLTVVNRQAQIEVFNAISFSRTHVRVCESVCIRFVRWMHGALVQPSTRVHALRCLRCIGIDFFFGSVGRRVGCQRAWQTC